MKTKPAIVALFLTAAFSVFLGGCAALARANETEYHEFPEAKQNSPLREAMPRATELFEESTGRTPLRWAIDSDEWDYERNPASGVMTRRLFYAWMGWEHDPNYCKLALNWFYQERVGGGWSTLRYGGEATNRSGYIGGKIDCAKLEPAQRADK